MPRKPPPAQVADRNTSAPHERANRLIIDITTEDRSARLRRAPCLVHAKAHRAPTIATPPNQPEEQDTLARQAKRPQPHDEGHRRHDEGQASMATPRHPLRQGPKCPPAGRAIQTMLPHSEPKPFPSAIPPRFAAQEAGQPKWFARHPRCLSIGPHTTTIRCADASPPWAIRHALAPPIGYALQTGERKERNPTNLQTPPAQHDWVLGNAHGRSYLSLSRRAPPICRPT